MVDLKTLLTYLAVLLYEPDHPEASKFQALIEEKVQLGKYILDFWLPVIVEFSKYNLSRTQGQ